MLKYFLNLIVIIAPLFVKAQVTLSNPFSYYGIGMLANSSDPIQRAMGNSSFAYSDSTMVNYYNSASHASLAKGYPLFSLSLKGEFSKIQDGTTEKNAQYVSLEHLYIAVPFAERFGFAFGITPYSRRGYSFQNYTVIDGDSLRFEYEGKGSLTKGFGALSANIIQRKNFGFSVGTNLGYIFGETSNSRTSVFAGDTEGGVSVSADRIKSFHYDFSASLRYQLNDKHCVQASFYYDPSQNLRAESSENLYFFQSGASSDLLSSADSSGTISSAPAMKVGLNYSQKFHRTTRKNKDFDSELNYVLEYQETSLTQFKYNYKATPVPYTADFSRLSIGIQYTPNIDIYKNTGMSSIWNSVKYRVGAYSSQLPYQTNNQTYSEFGTTFGIGIPLVAQFSFSSLNVGFDIGKRSNAAAGSLNENFIGFNFGIIISPSQADKWFRKVKLD